MSESTSKEAILDPQKYTIGGVEIQFPHKAYPSQISMMDKIIRSLNKKQNCLLESPTGSGKSLALLCSTLAWQNKFKRYMIELENELENQFATNSKVTVLHASPQIISTVPVYGIPQTPKSRSDTTQENKQANPVLNLEKYRYKQPKKTPLIIYIDDENDFQPSKKFKLPKDISNQKSTDEHSPSVVLSNSIDTPNDKVLEINSISKNCNTECAGNNLDKTVLIGKSENAATTSASPCAGHENKVLQKVPKIYFGTRTHKQISQIIRELKKTPYRDVQMTILSSRDRTCINQLVLKSPNKNEECSDLINAIGGPACVYYRNHRKITHEHPSRLSEAWDLEDLIHRLKNMRACPYFSARGLVPNSDVIFCPYNYLVDPMVRQSLDINLNNSIIIMDEAHNLEDTAREAASLKLSEEQLLETVNNMHEVAQSRGEMSPSYYSIAKIISSLATWLRQNNPTLSHYVSFESSSKVYTGQELVAVLTIVGAGPEHFKQIKKDFSVIEQEEGDPELNTGESLKLLGKTMFVLKAFIVIMNYLYKNELMYMCDYKGIVKKENVSTPYIRRRSNIPSSKEELSITFHCLNPAVAFSDIKGHIHSLIVASGTLSPLTSFQSELAMPFEVTLEANHVISRSQLWVGTIGHGPGGSELCATFHNANTFSFQDEIGRLVLEVCTIVPYGVLCFVPSYGMLDKLISRWQTTGLWDRISLKKVIVCEPKGASRDFEDALAEFYAAVEDTMVCDEDESAMNGGLFIAVCRGKTKEYTFKGHGDSVDQLCWHPNNPDLLATASLDKTVRIWDARQQKAVGTIPTKGENINICWSPNGQTIAVGNKEDLVTFIDAKSQKTVDEHQFKFEVNELSWNNDSSCFFLTNGQGCIYILSYPELQVRLVLNAHPANCICIEFDKTGKYFATGSVDALVSLWDVEHLVCIRTFSRLEWPVRTISFSHDGCMLASASEDHLIDIADVSTGEKIAEVPCESPTFTVAWHPKRYLLAFACDDKDKHARERDAGTVKLFGISSDSS